MMNYRITCEPHNNMIVPSKILCDYQPEELDFQEAAKFELEKSDRNE